jgi:hypothetical protein
VARVSWAGGQVRLLAGLRQAGLAVLGVGVVPDLRRTRIGRGLPEAAAWEHGVAVSEPAHRPRSLSRGGRWAEGRVGDR